jgi:hypothetical protein
MANISMSMNISRHLNCADKEQRDGVEPVIITSLIKAGAPSGMLDATMPLSTIANALEYEVFCPNCARCEIASTRDMVKHLCNCGYGVYVEMLRTSPN